MASGTYHIDAVDPRDGSRVPILNGETSRPASWKSHAAAQAQADNYRAHRRFNSGRDTWTYDFEVVPA